MQDRSRTERQTGEARERLAEGVGTADAGGSITPGAQETFHDLTFNLTDVSIDLTTLKV